MLRECYPPHLHVAEETRLRRITRGNRGNRISLTNVRKVALCSRAFPAQGGQKPQPPCETGSTICAAGLQPHTDDNFPRGGCTDVHTNAMHLEPRDRSRNILWRHSRRTRASI